MLSDNERRAPQWRRHVGEFLARRLGGTPESWAEANRTAAERAWARWLESLARGVPLRDAMREYDVGWLRAMAADLGAVLPSDDDAVAGLTREVSRYVTSRVRAFYPDVTEALRRLHARGVVLRTASGGREEDLDAYLRAEGVREHFGTLYGTDLVDTWKGGPDFYERVFAHAGVRPRDAVVVDDGAGPVTWARAAGATAYLMDRAGTSGDPDALRSLDGLLRRL